MASREGVREKMSEWFNVKDELPDNGGDEIHFLVATNGGEVCTAYRDPSFSETNWYYTDDGTQIHGVTHWMPLPNHPLGIVPRY